MSISIYCHYCSKEMGFRIKCPNCGKVRPITDLLPQVSYGDCNRCKHSETWATDSPCRKCIWADKDMTNNFQLKE